MERSLSPVGHTLPLLHRMAELCIWDWDWPTKLKIIALSLVTEKVCWLLVSVIKQHQNRVYTFCFLTDDLVIKHTNYRMIFQVLTLVNRISSDPGFKSWHCVNLVSLLIMSLKWECSYYQPLTQLLWGWTGVKRAKTSGKPRAQYSVRTQEGLTDVLIHAAQWWRSISPKFLSKSNLQEALLEEGEYSLTPKSRVGT